MKVVNFRIDADTLGQLDGLVEAARSAGAPDTTRSQVIRDLIIKAAVRRNPERHAAVIQAAFDYSQMQKIIFRRLAKEMQARIPEVVEKAIADTEQRLGRGRGR